MVGQHAEDSGSGEVTPLPQSRHSGEVVRESSSRGESTPFIAYMLGTILAALLTPQETPRVTPKVKRLLSVLRGEVSRQETLHALGLSDGKSLRQRYLSPALECGYVEMTRADTPNPRNQKYRLTGRGRAAAQ